MFQIDLPRSGSANRCRASEPATRLRSLHCGRSFIGGGCDSGWTGRRFRAFARGQISSSPRSRWRSMSMDASGTVALSTGAFPKATRSSGSASSRAIESGIDWSSMPWLKRGGRRSGFGSMRIRRSPPTGSKRGSDPEGNCSRSVSTRHARMPRPERISAVEDLSRESLLTRTPFGFFLRKSHCGDIPPESLFPSDQPSSFQVSSGRRGRAGRGQQCSSSRKAQGLAQRSPWPSRPILCGNLDRQWIGPGLGFKPCLPWALPAYDAVRANDRLRPAGDRRALGRVVSCSIGTTCFATEFEGTP